VIDIQKDAIYIAILGGQEKLLTVGDKVIATGLLCITKGGSGILGQVISVYGECLNRYTFHPAEYFFTKTASQHTIFVTTNSPEIVARMPIRFPLHTGCLSIDCFFPIGLGQRQLILGDRNTGKTTLALTTILNQRFCNYTYWAEVHLLSLAYTSKKFVRDPTHCFHPCIYVVIGQRRTELLRVMRLFYKFFVAWYTCIIFTGAEDWPVTQYLAPYAGTAIGEQFCKAGFHCLVIYDSLSQHAITYRQLSLLLRRPPAREAYPSDIFYIHSRLLEHAAQLHSILGGGSLTALPLIETQMADIAGYIPTNVISITDGQLFLSTKIKNSGRIPAVDFGLSVSRTGSAAQNVFFSEIAKLGKETYFLYRRVAGIERVGGDIPVTVAVTINRGKRLSIVMSQRLYRTYALYKELFLIYVFSLHFFDAISYTYTAMFLPLIFNIHLAQTYLSTVVFKTFIKSFILNVATLFNSFRYFKLFFTIFAESMLPVFFNLQNIFIFFPELKAILIRTLYAPTA
jgi:F-type H+-transporting ATPase subunit alpha